MLNVGLTGGIASGKSTVAGMLREKGAFLVDFDVLTHEAEEPGQPAWKAIVDYFGGEILYDDGTINRTKLGAVVFQDHEKLARLNEIVHPLLFREWRRRLADIEAKDPAAIIVSDIPLLIEINAQNLVDLIVLVYASPRQQLERLMSRNGCTSEEALQRLASQVPIDEKISQADIVFENGATLEETRQAIDELWAVLIRREENKASRRDAVI
jgi:dephospho-CoA kinase